MKHLNIYLFVLSAILAIISCSTKNSNISSKIDLSKGWKFEKGDQIEWAKPDFIDTSWANINADKLWEEQGVTYDGFAWYRTKVVIPSELKENSFFKDSIIFFMGKIDDTDQTFLNGSLIGQNGKTIAEKDKDNIGEFIKQPDTYNKPRRYALSVEDKRIKWDEPNVIAIRVNDHGGGGGIYDLSPYIGMIDVSDFIKMDITSKGFENEDSKIKKTISIENISSTVSFQGKLKIVVNDLKTKGQIYKEQKDLILDKGQKHEVTFSFMAPESENYLVNYSFLQDGAKNEVSTSHEIPYILTPKSKESPRINGAKIIGARPGKPFLFRVTASGVKPMKFSADKLPQGLKLDEVTGIIKGAVAKKGEYVVKIKAENGKGSAERDLKIVIGDKVALTPPMGWNSWNCWGLSVSEEKVKQCADLIESTGLADHGWTYINIDDGWEKGRDNKGEIIVNEKFTDMKALCDYVHSKGLKIGIYSSPGPKTCGGYEGSFGYELQDAKSYAKWGIDYLKYDWCSYGEKAKDNSVPELQKPYQLMRECLNKVDRDIVYSLCQYGMGNVWEWGGKVGGDLWRTTGDIVDTWGSLSGIGFSQGKCSEFAKPGYWNDPDMLIVGWVGWGPNLHITRLSANEQYTHISLWSLLSAPLLLGCDLSRLDQFTLNLLTNDEVIDIDQDPLGMQARQVVNTDSVQVWVKDLEDGSKAVGVFNMTNEGKNFLVNWAQIGLKGKQSVRDVWRQKELGVLNEKFETSVPYHGVTLVKVTSKE